MSTYEHLGRLYEVQEFSPVDEDGFHYELWDLAPDGGEVGVVVVPESATDTSDILIKLNRFVPSTVVLWWLRSVPQLRLQIHEGG